MLWILFGLTLGGLSWTRHSVAAQEITRFPIPRLDSRPEDLTVGPDGNIWFTELGTARIGRITPQGTITEFRLPWAKAFATNDGPRRITSGPDGNLWFTLPARNSIGRMTLSGALVEFPLPSASALEDITVGPDGNIWFTQDNAKIGRLTPAGVLTEFPTPPGRGLSGISSGPDGALWFAERNEPNIGRITTDGVVTEFPFSSSSSASYHIVTGADGHLWFTTSERVVGRLALDGTHVEFPVGQSSGEIVRGPDDHLWVTLSSGGGGLARISLQGNVTSYPLAPFFPRGLIAGPDGHLWFALHLEGEIVRFALPPTPTPKPTLAPRIEQVYVGRLGSTRVIDPQTLETLAEIPSLIPLAARPDGREVYGACGTLCIVDTTSNRIVANPAEPTAVDVAFSSDGRLAYVVGFDDEIVVFDTATRSITARIPNPCPDFIALSPDDRLLYVGMRSCANQIAILDVASRAHIDTIETDFPQGATFSKGGSLLYVIETGGPIPRAGLAIRQRPSHEVITRIPFPNASGFVVSPDGDTGYLFGFGSDVAVIDLQTNTERQRIPAPLNERVGGLGLTHDGRRGFASDHGRIHVLDMTVPAFTEMILDADARLFGSIVIAHRDDITPLPTQTPTATPSATFITPPATVTPTPTYDAAQDCDRNGVLDGAQISDDADEDCNANGVVDACDVGLVVALSQPQAHATGDYPRSVVAADFDGDGIVDLAAADSSGNSFDPPDTIAILYGRGQREFAAAAMIASGHGTEFAAAADIDGDDDIDLLAVNHWDQTMVVLRNSGRGTFVASNPVALPQRPTVINTANLTNDDDLDVVVTYSAYAHVSILISNGTGGFAAPDNIAIPDSTSAVGLGDFDADGDVDLAVPVSSFATGVRIFANDGNGQFALRTNLSAGEFPTSVAVADLDQDGRADLAVLDSQRDSVAVLLRHDDEAFRPARKFPAGSRPFRIQAGDIDGDGDSDLIVISTFESRVNVLLNDGDGAFAVPSAFGIGAAPFNLSLADLDNDQRLDVITVTPDTDAVSILWNGHADVVHDPSSADCNLNRLPDSCELAFADCDTNGMPDDCQSDMDADGVPDACEQCPGENDLIDGDRDGLGDCHDGCPQDSDKGAPGICGCSVFEDDRDADLTPDCVDECPNDPAIAVLADVPDANCDRRVNAADVSALLLTLASGARSACFGDDANRDCRATVADLAPLFAWLFSAFNIQPVPASFTSGAVAPR